MDNVNTSEKSLLQRMFGFVRGFGGSTTNTGNRLLYEGYLSGYQYHQGQQFEHLFAPGTGFSLRHEPENPFDEQAVAVYYSNKRIGFIPNGWNEKVARMLKRGKSLRARVSRFDPSLEPWERLQVEVLYEPEPTEQKE